LPEFEVDGTEEGWHLHSDLFYKPILSSVQFVKFGLTSDALKSYVTLIAKEVEQFVASAPALQGQKGTFNVCRTMAEITIYTASRSLQGKEVRERFDSSFAELYHDLDMGFAPINFMLPSVPFPHNRKRDYAQKKMAQTYMDIIRERRKAGVEKTEDDMIWNLMCCVYKDGTPVPDMEVAHMMIALLMAGQHSSSSSSAWIVLRLATRPDIQDELLAEQKRVLGEHLPPLTHDNLQDLHLNSKVVKETLRLHAPIHSIMRKVKSPMPVTVASPSTKSYTIPTTHNLLAAPGVTSRYSDFFPEPMLWEPHRWDEDNPLAYKADKGAADDDEKDEQIDYGYGMVSKGTNSPYLPFGAGRHRCIGEQFAYLQLGTILATMVRLLKVRNLDGKDGQIPDTDYSSLFSRPMAPAAVVRWERRGGVKGEKN
jgi:sterol 14alpha-demethylase